MLGSSSRRAATLSSWARVVRSISESNSGVFVMMESPPLRSGFCPQAEHGERAPRQIVVIAGAVRAGGVGSFPGPRVEHRLPADPRLVGGQDEGDGLVVRVEQ